MQIKRYKIDDLDNLEVKPTNIGYTVRLPPVYPNLIPEDKSEIYFLDIKHPYQSREPTTLLTLPKELQKLIKTLNSPTISSLFTGWFIDSGSSKDNKKVSNETPLYLNDQLDILNESLEYLFCKSKNKIWEHFLTTSNLPQEEISKLNMINISNSDSIDYIRYKPLTNEFSMHTKPDIFFEIDGFKFRGAQPFSYQLKFLKQSDKPTINNKPIFDDSDRMTECGINIMLRPKKVNSNKSMFDLVDMFNPSDIQRLEDLNSHNTVINNIHLFGYSLYDDGSHKIDSIPVYNNVAPKPDEEIGLIFNVLSNMDSLEKTIELIKTEIYDGPWGNLEDLGFNIEYP